MSYQTTRRIDDLGRVIIPKSIREKLNIKADDEVLLTLYDDCITVKKIEESDTLKNSNDV